MGEIQFNIEREKRFIELLGYDLVGPNGSNRWIIIDENQDQVGYIQLKKTSNGNSKKGYVKTFGYQTFIDSPSIKCEFLRELNDREGNILNNPYFYYSFYIKRDNKETDHVHMKIGNNSSLTVWSEKYGYMSFKIDSDGLYLNFKSQTDNFNIEEVLRYKNIDSEYHENKRYVYQIRYCDKEHELSDFNPLGRTTREIGGIEYYNHENKIELFERKWVEGDLKICRENAVEGTVEKLATKNKMGIDCFNHFRFLINQIIPFKEDVISVLVSEDMVKQNNLSMFIPDYEKEILETPVKKNKTK